MGEVTANSLGSFEGQPPFVLHYTVDFLNPPDVANMARTVQQFCDEMMKKRKIVKEILVRKGAVIVDGSMFKVVAGNRTVIAAAKTNPICWLGLVQQTPHWIVQVKDDSYVWKATLNLFNFIQAVMKPQRLRMELDFLVLDDINQLLIAGKIKKIHHLKILHLDQVCQWKHYMEAHRDLLTNVEGLETFEHRPHAMPRFDLIANLQHVYLPNVSQWMTHEQVLQMNCVYLEIGYIDWTLSIHQNLVTKVAMQWQNSRELPRTRIIRFDSVPRSEYGIPWDGARRPKYFRYINPMDGEKMRIDTTSGLDTIREDGTVATIVSRRVEYEKESDTVTASIFIVWAPCDFYVSEEEVRRNGWKGFLIDELL